MWRIDVMLLSYCVFFFNDTATTEIYTYYTLFPYATLFRSLSQEHGDYELSPMLARIAAAISGAAGGRARQAALCSSARHRRRRSEEHTSELQSLMRISYAVFCLKTKKKSRTLSPRTTYATTPAQPLPDSHTVKKTEHN